MPEPAHALHAADGSERDGALAVVNHARVARRCARAHVDRGPCTSSKNRAPRSRRLAAGRVGRGTMMIAATAAFSTPTALAHTPTGFSATTPPGLAAAEPGRHLPSGLNDVRDLREADGYRSTPLRRNGVPGDRQHITPDPVGTETRSSAMVALPPNEDEPVCSTGRRVYLVYSWPSNGTNNAAVRAAQIRETVRRMNWKLISESKNSSHPDVAAQIRVNCAGDVPTVNVVQSHAHGAEPNPNHENNIRQSVQAHFDGSVPAGHLGEPTGSSARKYLVFHDGPNPHTHGGTAWGWMGASTTPQFSIKSSASNYNNNNTTTGILWFPQDLWQTHNSLHELAHTMGAVQMPLDATGSDLMQNTNVTSEGHCIDGDSTMCYNDGSPEGGGFNSQACPDAQGFATPIGFPFDCGYDNYFDTNPATGSYLAQMWNVGGAENGFIHRSTP